MKEDKKDRENYFVTGPDEMDAILKASGLLNLIEDKEGEGEEE